MQLLNGLTFGKKTQLSAEIGGNRIRDIRRQIGEDRIKDLAQRARAQIAQSAVDRDDAPGMQR